MKCLLCQKEGKLSHGLRVLDFFCEVHYALLKEAEEKSNILHKLYETRTRALRGIEKLD